MGSRNELFLVVLAFITIVTVAEDIENSFSLKIVDFPLSQRINVSIRNSDNTLCNFAISF